MKNFRMYAQRMMHAWPRLRRRSPVRPQEISPDGSAANLNRYARDWDSYSQMWDAQYGNQYTHLGDEWNDDNTPDRQRDLFYFTAYAQRWLEPHLTVLEVGPGGGKWTIRLAPQVKRVLVLDVAENMLRRTRVRCESLGITNVEYLLANGRDFQPVADASIDFFFSYDVFVHIALEDTWPYAQEIARVLAPGGRGVCHHAINTVPEAWDRIEQNNEWYRGGRNSLGQFYYFSPETLRRMYERCGLRILEQHQEAWHCVCVFEKPAESIIPQLEELLRQLASPKAEDAEARTTLIAALELLPSQLDQNLRPLLEQLRKEENSDKRQRHIAAIRRLWRGV